jgi:tRNA uridine 5-carboxymethylaminomethyl modification enzyme
MNKYDVIVIGAGHAGCEASYISAKLGKKTLLITQNMDNIAQMSCNPSIGGVGKGNLVKEIDALGGIMARVIDETGLQFRTLNRKKGPAVQGIRAQADRSLYSIYMRKTLENMLHLTIKQGDVSDIIISNNNISGVRINTDETIIGKSIIITCGTFLNGLIHIGKTSISGGRLSEPASSFLTQSLIDLGIKTDRLKTGTPPRIDKKTINFEKLQRQTGDEPVPFFSFWTKRKIKEQVPCYIAYTNINTQKIIKDNIQKSALYSGKIKGIGPRYCPSIEDKIVKFPNNISHQIFVEPEGLETNVYYPSGVSTSLPIDVQYKFLRSIEGFENVEILKPGYAIEYDFFPPEQLNHTLESKLIENLYFAGQVNGTSGYEEAAAQGLIAGINAVLKNDCKEPLILKRNEAYIGVMIDDLILKGCKEPYRMFTSRAEYRLLLRHTNTHIRLLKYSKKYSLLYPKEINQIIRYKNGIRKFITYSKEKKVAPEEVNGYLHKINEKKIDNKISLINLLKRTKVDINILNKINSCEKHNDNIINEGMIEIKYEGYIRKQLLEVERLKNYETKIIPDMIDYDLVKGLKKEAREKLKNIRPNNIGAALRIPGITPSDVNNIIIKIKNKKSS